MNVIHYVCNCVYLTHKHERVDNKIYYYYCQNMMKMQNIFFFQWIQNRSVTSGFDAIQMEWH